MVNDTRTPRKAPAKRTARARPAAAIEGVVVGKAETVALSAAAPAAVNKRPTVTLLGRPMAVQLPTGEQLDIILDTYEELGTLSQTEVDEFDEDKQTKAAERVRRLLRRARVGAMTVLVDEDDQEWVKDQLLSGRAKLNDVAALLPQAVAVLTSKPKAPTTGPAPKARRRA